MAAQKQIFYIYDTVHSGRMFTSVPSEHRDLIASIAKRSRYFLAYPPKIDQPWQTSGQDEIGFRFFEGAASGTVMIGQPPDKQAFREHFDWPDAVIPMAFDEPDVAKFLKKLDSEPERTAEIRKNGVVQSLLRHDWAYRWREILGIVGLAPRPELVAREQRLENLAEIVNNMNTWSRSNIADAYSR
jgi:spore maturation protein CgeB